MPALLLSTTLLLGCPTRKEVQAEIWNHASISKEICDANPSIKEYGISRQLDDGRWEFISYCQKEARDYIGIKTSKMNEFLDALLPEDKK